jgi:hypothetical protein
MERANVMSQSTPDEQVVADRPDAECHVLTSEQSGEPLDYLSAVTARMIATDRQRAGWWVRVVSVSWRRQVVKAFC